MSKVIDGFAAVTESGPQQVSQGYGLVRAYRFFPDDSGLPPSEAAKFVDVALQVNIRRDAYENQSHYQVKILTPGGWQLLHSLLPSEVEDAMPSYVVWGRQAGRIDCIRATELIAAKLVSEAANILGA